MRWLVFPATTVPTATSFFASLHVTTFGVFLFLSSSLVGRHLRSTWMLTPRLESDRDMEEGFNLPGAQEQKACLSASRERWRAVSCYADNAGTTLFSSKQLVARTEAC